MGGYDGQRQPEDEPLHEAQPLPGLLPEHPDGDQMGPRADQGRDGGQQDDGREEQGQHHHQTGPFAQGGGQCQEHREGEGGPARGGRHGERGDDESGRGQVHQLAHGPRPADQEHGGPAGQTGPGHGGGQDEGADQQPHRLVAQGGEEGLTADHPCHGQRQPRPERDIGVVHRGGDPGGGGQGEDGEGEPPVGTEAGGGAGDGEESAEPEDGTEAEGLPERERHGVQPLKTR